MEPKPTCTRHLSLVFYILLCCAHILSAAPARKGLLNLWQPDGTLVRAYLSGDEHGHLVLTPDGCSLMQDAEGWWCYARYDYYGHRHNTGVHAGDPDTPGEVIAASREIPYSLLRQRRAARIRRTVPLRNRELARTRAGETGGVRHGLIILAQFPDLEFQYGRDQFETLVNGSGATSALSYFKDQWKDGYTFRFDITEIVTLPQNYAYYGANNDKGEDDKAPEMIRDACAAVGPEISFSDYDNDGDGEIDEDVRDSRSIVLVRKKPQNIEDVAKMSQDTETYDLTKAQIDSLSVLEKYNIIDIDMDGKTTQEDLDEWQFVYRNPNERDEKDNHLLKFAIDLSFPGKDLDEKIKNKELIRHDTDVNNIKYPLEKRKKMVGGCWVNYDEEEFLKWFEGRNAE